MAALPARRVWHARGVFPASRAGSEGSPTLWGGREISARPDLPRANADGGSFAKVMPFASRTRLSPVGSAFAEFPGIKIEEQAPRILTMDQQRFVLEAIPWERRGAFLVAATEAPRMSEIRALDLNDYQDGNCAKPKIAREAIVRALSSPAARADASPRWSG